MKLDNGRVVPWIDENLNPFTGEWLCRAFEKTWQDGKADPDKREERGKDYNHSTYCDLVINGLIGIRPQMDDSIVVRPLAPDSWDYFCLDGVQYHGRMLTVVWDKTGDQYEKGQGLAIFADGIELARSGTLSRITAKLFRC